MPRTGNVWIADRRIFLDANGEVVDEKDPARVQLLVGKGGEIPMDTAIRLGLAEAPPEPEIVAFSQEAVDVERFTNARVKAVDRDGGGVVRNRRSNDQETPDDANGPASAATVNPTPPANPDTGQEPAKSKGGRPKKNQEGQAGGPADKSTKPTAPVNDHLPVRPEPGQEFPELSEAQKAEAAGQLPIPETTGGGATPGEEERTGGETNPPTSEGDDSGPDVGDSNAPGVKPADA